MDFSFREGMSQNEGWWQQWFGNKQAATPQSAPQTDSHEEIMRKKDEESEKMLGLPPGTLAKRRIGKVALPTNDTAGTAAEFGLDPKELEMKKNWKDNQAMPTTTNFGQEPTQGGGWNPFDPNDNPNWEKALKAAQKQRAGQG